MAENRNLPGLYFEYLNKYKTMSVATVGESGIPDCSTVYFAFNSDGEIYFCSDKSTTKSTNLEHTGNCAVALNDGGSTAMGVKLFGKAAEIDEDGEKALAREALLTRIPSIEPFLENPNLAFYKILPEWKYLINFSWGIDWKVLVE